MPSRAPRAAPPAPRRVCPMPTAPAGQRPPGHRVPSAQHPEIRPPSLGGHWDTARDRPQRAGEQRPRSIPWARLSPCSSRGHTEGSHTSAAPSDPSNTCDSLIYTVYFAYSTIYIAHCPITISTSALMYQHHLCAHRS